MRRFVFRLAVMLACAITLAGCGGGTPHESEKTLTYILQNGALRVGVIESMPWAGKGFMGAKGVEGWIVSQYARSTNVGAKWYYLSEDDAFGDLQDRKLDIVIGGLTDDRSEQENVTLTRPYFATSREPGRVLAVQTGETRFLLALERFMQEHSQDIQDRMHRANP